jgi:hypothetical protein
MGLYLCVFDENEDIEGVDVGAYSDFDFFRRAVTELLEEGINGSKYPTLINHADSDGEWSPSDCAALKRELEEIIEKFKELPTVEFPTGWQQQVGRLLGLKPSNLYDSFIDVDGERLLDRLHGLCEIAIQINKPIVFQ